MKNKGYRESEGFSDKVKRVSFSSKKKNKDSKYADREYSFKDYKADKDKKSNRNLENAVKSKNISRLLHYNNDDQEDA